MAFQMKCFKKFEDLQKQNKTILFVTHSLDSIIRYCNRSIVIEQGKMIADTTPKDGVDIFKKVLTGNFQKQESDSLLDNENKSTVLKDMIEINKDALEYGNGRVKIIDFAIIDEENKPNTVLDYNSEFTIYMKVKFFDEIKDPIFAFTIKDAKGLEITGTNSLIKHVLTGSYKDGDEVTVTFKQKANIQLGKYALSLGCVNLSDGDIEVYQRLYDVLFFDVVGSEQMVGFYDLGSDVVVSNTN
jgi:teichoic acid transport system ATP-binding protein